MNALDKAKELIDKNRLLVTVSVAWIIVSNLLYFSQMNEVSCLDLRTFEGTSAPDWMILWSKLTLGYVSLYEILQQPNFLSQVTCFQYGFSDAGYFSFILLPIMTIIMLVVAVNWVRRA